MRRKRADFAHLCLLLWIIRRENINVNVHLIFFYHYIWLILKILLGTTAAQLIAGVENLTDGCIRGRFFPCFPHRDIRISSWLASWIRQGAVPMVTLNLQRAVPVGWAVPDAWHHQMVYGVGPKGEGQKYCVTFSQALSWNRCLFDEPFGGCAGTNSCAATLLSLCFKSQKTGCDVTMVC